MGKTLKEVIVTLQERWAATRPNIFLNKKKYRRKEKHPRKGLDT
jgi:hypothetical protein